MIFSYNKKRLVNIILVIIILNFIIAGIVGVNYGKYWDEFYLIVGLKNQIKSLTLIPNEYTYNTIYFYLGLIVLAPEILESLVKIIIEIARQPTRPLNIEAYNSLLALSSNLNVKIMSQDFLIMVRVLYILISSLTILWIYKSSKIVCQNKSLFGVIGAIILSLSWEFQYHSRWIAIDNILVQFATLAILLMLKSLKANDEKKSRHYLILAAIFCGFAIACKITAILLIIPLIYCSRIHSKTYQKYKKFKQDILIVLVILGSFFFLTPGAIVDPIRFGAALLFEFKSYNINNIPGYTHYSSGFSDHISRAYNWLFFIAPSSNIFISSMVFTVAFIGAVDLFKRERKVFNCLALFFISYTVFIGFNKLFIVRNWLVLFPIIVIFTSRGTLYLYTKFDRSKFKIVGLTIFAIIIIINLSIIWINSISILNKNSQNNLLKLNTFLLKESESFYISKTLYSKLLTLGKPLVCSSINSDFNELYKLYLISSEQDQGKWVAGKRKIVEMSFGSNAANYSYYPSWLGSSEEVRIYKISGYTANKMKLELNNYLYCSPKILSHR